MKREQALARQTGQRNIVGARLKQARRTHDPPWTMEQLSLAVEAATPYEISLSTLGKIEAGIRAVYDYEVAALAQTLGIDTNWLLGISDERHPSRASPG